MDQTKILPAGGAGKKITIYFFLFIAFLIFILVFLFRPELFNADNFFGLNNSEKNNATEDQKFFEGAFLEEAEFEETKNSEVSGGKNLLESENFKIKQITFGGSAVSGIDTSENLPVNIANLESEALLSEDNKEAKLLISWETNKEALSAVEYSRSDGQNSKKALEKKYASNHRLVLSGLDPGAVYIYRIKSRDRWGNEFLSEYYSVYSGSPAVSVFDLISKSMNEIFGWAIKK